MAYNGSGIFNRLYSWAQDAINGLFISSSRMDNEMNGMATGLTNCVTRDGQSPWLANLPAGGFKITNLANGSAAADSAAFGQIPTDFGIGALFTGGNTGAAFNFDPASGRDQFWTLNANTTCTLVSPSPATKTGWYYLLVQQDGTGGRTLAFTGAAYSPAVWINNAAAPTASMPAAYSTMFAFFWNGTAWRQQMLGWLGRQKTYAAQAYRNGAQATSAGVSTKVQFNAVVNDPYSEWDTTTNFRWTPKNPGLYLFTFQLVVQNASAAQVSAQINSNVYGTTVNNEMRAVAGVNTTLYGSWGFAVTATNVASGAYAEVDFTSTTGAGTIQGANQGNSFAHVLRLGDIE